MSTPLDVALDIRRTVVEARDEERPIDIAVCASELHRRFLASGCTRKQIAEALEDEAILEGVTTH